MSHESEKWDDGKDAVVADLRAQLAAERARVEKAEYALKKETEQVEDMFALSDKHFRERDALRAENERLRGALEAIDACTSTFRCSDCKKTARAALAPKNATPKESDDE